MSKNWIAVNVLLMAVAGLLGWRLYVTTKLFSAENDVAKLQPVADMKGPMVRNPGLPPLQQLQALNTNDFAVIPNQNVFSDTRTREDKTDPAPAVVVQELTVKPVLVGVTISGNQRLAMIIDPTAGNQKTTIKRPGDMFQQGYIITDITENQIVLENGPRKEIIPLFDGTKHTANAGKTPILATRVVSFAGGPSGTATPTPIYVAGSPVRPVVAGSARPIPTPVSQQATPAAAPAAQQPLRPGESIDAQGRRVIRTPFGDMVAPPVPAPSKPPNH